MRVIAVLAVWVAVTLALPTNDRAVSGEGRPAPVPIVRMSYDNDNRGQYGLKVQSGDNTVIHEEGHLKDLGDHGCPPNVKSGSYSYVGPDGKNYTVSWTADERGFIPTGDHLPKPPTDPHRSS